MANNSPTIVAASLSDDQLKKSIDSLVTHVDEAMKKMVQSTNNAVGEMEAKLKSLGNLKIDSNGSADGGASKRAKAQNADTVAIKESTQAYKEKSMTLDQQASAINTAVQSEKKYTDEVLRQAAAIRSSKEWQEKGHVVVGDVNYYDKERANVSKRDKQLLLSLEEQIVQAQQKEAQEALVAAEAKRQQAQAAKEAAQASKGVSAYDLGIDPNVSAGRQRQIESTRAASKETEYLKQQVASLLEVEEREVKSVNMATASYSELSQYLKQLQSAYNKLGADRIKKSEGVDIANEIQRTQRAMQKLQQTMSRPVSLKDALGGSEKTLDDIAYKMQRLRAYRQGIDLTKPNAANEIKQVDEALAKLQKDADKWMSKSQELVRNNTALGRSWNYMKNRLAFYFTVGASTQFIKNLIEVRSQYEMNERALGILINSAERGTQIFNELSQMALVSPYTLIELSTAAKQLTAYDIAAKDVVDTTRRLADMASAVGIPIERLTYALGQIKAYGYLNSRDARMFANAGIPLVKQLSDYYTQLEGRLVSTADVYDRIKKKTIDYEQVVQVINKMTDEGGKFFDFQAKMADTLKVRLANLTLAWNNMLNDMGSSNQGVLTTGIGLLRDMFLHWKDLESAISKVAAAFGIYKAAQLVTLIWTGRITTAMGVQELVGKKLQARFASLTVAQKGFVSAATAGWAALAFVVADAWLTISRNMEEIEQLNKSIADGAKESYEAIDKMLHSSEMVSTRLSAAQGKLSDTDAAKAWEVLREQIELSAASSKELIAQLLKEPDINKRVTESFNLAEKIEEANRKLSDLNDSLDVSQNSILGGLFGEGLAEDIDDYNARIKYTSDVAEWASKKNRGFWENAAMGLRALFNEVKDAFGSDANEAQDEIKNFAQKAAQTIKDELGEEGIKDKIQVNEAIARIVRGMEQQFPQIRGKGKVLFETIFYDTMANEFKGAVDSQAYYYEKFLEQLKKDHASAFSGVTEDINKETFKWSSAQIDAIQKTADKVKKDLPAASQGAIDEILRQLNSTDFKVRIVAEMATTSLDNVQKQFREKFIEKPWIADDKEREKAENEANQRYGTLMRKNTESNAEYEKRISDERKKQLELSQKNADIITKNKGKQEEFSKAVLADAQKQKEAADDWLKAAKDIEDKGGYDFSTKGENAAARKAQKAAESELQKTLKEELQLIDKVRSSYDKLTKAGVGHFEAIEASTQGFDRSVKNINKVLNKYGIALDLSKFAGTTNPHELVEMLQKQIDVLMKSPNAKPAEIQDLEVKVQKLGLDVKEFDHKTFTDSLNNELGRLKDEYELAVSLDADPELGSYFANMMGINMDDLPRTVDEYAKRVTEEMNKYLSSTDAGFQLSDLFLSNKSLRALEERVKEGTLNEVVYKKILDSVNAVREARKKDFEETTKGWNDLMKKYSEYEVKIEEIRQASDKERVSFVKQYGSAADKSLAVRLNSSIAAEQDQSKKEELRAQLISLVHTLAQGDDVKLKIAVAIDKSQSQQEAKTSFEEFQKSPEWIVATGDLAGMTNKAIGGLIDTIERYKKKAKNLDPKQIKSINNALKALYKQQRSNNPFNIIGNAIMEAKDRAATFEPRIKEIKDEMDKITADVAKGTATEKAKKRLGELIAEYKELTNAQRESGKVNATDVVGGINNAISAAQNAVSMFNQMAEALGGKGMTDAAKNINRVVNTLQMAGSGAAAGAQIGGGWGAAIGAVVGGLAGVITNWADVWSGNADITDSIERSAYWVRVLAREYKNLEYQLDKAAGTSEMYYQHLIALNKQAQLAELRRQLELEESRKSKNRDQDTIDSLKDQIDDLEREIKDTIDNIVNDFLGISSVGDAAESMMDAFIGALRNGEDAMAAFDESIDDMIANMVKKMFVTKILQPWLDEQWNAIQESINSRSKSTREGLATLYDSLSKLEQSDVDEVMLKGVYVPKNQAIDYIKQRITEYEKRLAEETTPTLEDIEHYAELLRSGRGTIEEWYDYMNGVIGDLGLMTDSGIDKNLSALQQGIQGITEQTAGALEAITNGISQQCYLQSDLLTQIRDTVQSFDIDVQTSTFAEMLLQLQISNQTQNAIRSIMEGWSSPNGMSVRVEMV